MSTLGFMLVGFGILTAWSGLEKVYVFDVLRSFMGAPDATPAKPSAAQPASSRTGGQPPAATSIPNAPAGPSNPTVVA